MGYHRAGFEVVGVDVKPQKNYPFEFHQGDALTFPLDGFDYVHASPPCQAHTNLRSITKRDYECFIERTRFKLDNAGVVYVIENVPGAPLMNPIRLCGTMFTGLRVLRHRLFESNVRLKTPLHQIHPLCFTRDKRKSHYGKLDEMTAFVQVTGGGNSSIEAAKAAMGINWMTKQEINQAIPPAYTEWIGRQLLANET